VPATSSRSALCIPQPPPLLPGELHIWHGPLLFPPDLLSGLAHLLSSDESSRAEKFVVPHARDSFIASRAILRKLLSSYTALDPSALLLTSNPHGKPRLSTNNAPPVSFNLSHSHGTGLLAFAQASEIGVDLEYIRPDFAAIEIADHFFSPAERAQLTALPPHARTAAFFRCWTRKEAYVKARGAGMSIPLDTFTIELAHNHPQRIRDEGDSLWTCYNLDMSQDFAAAVVAAGEGWQLRFFDWTISAAQD
jgi:4'-phosphopantetheinyl transferase